MTSYEKKMVREAEAFRVTIEIKAAAARAPDEVLAMGVCEINEVTFSFTDLYFLARNMKPCLEILEAGTAHGDELSDAASAAEIGSRMIYAIAGGEGTRDSGGAIGEIRDLAEELVARILGYLEGGDAEEATIAAESPADPLANRVLPDNNLSPQLVRPRPSNPRA